MKNFNRQCLADGTSALQSQCEHAPQGRGVIVEFPVCALDDAPTAEECLTFDEALACADERRFTLRERMGARCRSAIQHLSLGDIGGYAFNRVKPWQAALAGCTFSALAFASLFISL